MAPGTSDGRGNNIDLRAGKDQRRLLTHWVNGKVGSIPWQRKRANLPPLPDDDDGQNAQGGQAAAAVTWNGRFHGQNQPNGPIRATHFLPKEWMLRNTVILCKKRCVCVCVSVCVCVCVCLYILKTYNVQHCFYHVLLLFSMFSICNFIVILWRFKTVFTFYTFTIIVKV